MREETFWKVGSILFGVLSFVLFVETWFTREMSNNEELLNLAWMLYVVHCKFEINSHDCAIKRLKEENKRKEK